MNIEFFFNLPIQIRISESDPFIQVSPVQKDLEQTDAKALKGQKSSSRKRQKKKKVDRPTPWERLARRNEMESGQTSATNENSQIAKKDHPRMHPQSKGPGKGSHGNTMKRDSSKAKRQRRHKMPQLSVYEKQSIAIQSNRAMVHTFKKFFDKMENGQQTSKESHRHLEVLHFISISWYSQKAFWPSSRCIQCLDAIRQLILFLEHSFSVPSPILNNYGWLPLQIK